MSHELRTPLNAILGFGAAARARARSPRDQHDSVGHILKAGGHLLAAHQRGARDLAHRGGRAAPVARAGRAACELVREVADLVAPAGRRARDRRWTVDAGTEADVHVRADLQRLKQVLLNLLSNAIKYNRARRPGHASGLRPRPTGRMRVAVSDTGLGLRPDELERALQPVRAPRRRAAAHGGHRARPGARRARSPRRWAASSRRPRTGIGSGFWVRPAALALDTAAAPRPSRAPRRAGGSPARSRARPAAARALRRGQPVQPPPRRARPGPRRDRASSPPPAGPARHRARRAATCPTSCCSTSTCPTSPARGARDARRRPRHRGHPDGHLQRRRQPLDHRPAALDRGARGVPHQAARRRRTCSRPWRS